MTDLVKTARRAEGSDFLPKVSFGVMNAEVLILRMADRIEELKADVARLQAEVAAYEVAAYKKMAKDAAEPFVLRRRMEQRRKNKEHALLEADLKNKKAECRSLRSRANTAEAKLSDAVAYLERVGEVSPNVLAEALGPDADLHYASAIITQLKGENQ